MNEKESAILFLFLFLFFIYLFAFCLELHEPGKRDKINMYMTNGAAYWAGSTSAGGKLHTPSAGTVQPSPDK